jgi:hypothetical protein
MWPRTLARVSVEPDSLASVQNGDSTFSSWTGVKAT